MNPAEKKLIADLQQVIEKLKTGIPSKIKLSKDLNTIDPDLKVLSEEIQSLVQHQHQRNIFLMALANGKLEDQADYYKNLPGSIKQLHSDLMHLNWQAKQIIAGDLSQKVSFMGDFSDSFNQIIQGLRERKQMEGDLKTANHTKDKVFSIISHDLRSPFNVILGYSEILNQQVSNFSPEETASLSEKINHAAQSAFILLNNLLNWANMQQGKIKANAEIVMFKPLVESVFNTYQANAEIKKIDLLDTTKASDFFWADPSLISIVLSNLVNNAIKFSEQGSKIIVSSHKTERHLEISVSDFGVGIPSDKLDRLFEFDEIHSTIGTANEKGSGLGLMLCKEFVQMNNGEISVENNKPKGTIFSFSLPLFDNIEFD